jgi:hypothetical protein
MEKPREIKDNGSSTKTKKGSVKKVMATPRERGKCL